MGFDSSEDELSVTYVIESSTESPKQFEFADVASLPYYTSECMIPIFEAQPMITYNDKDLLEISGYDYETRINCDSLTDIDIQECLGAEFANYLWQSRIITDENT